MIAIVADRGGAQLSQPVLDERQFCRQLGLLAECFPESVRGSVVWSCAPYVDQPRPQQITPELRLRAAFPD